LSVSGMRGLVGRSLTDAVAARYAAAFGRWLVASGTTGEPPRVVIGRDSRPSGAEYERAAAAGLLAAGCRVTRLGILSTPGVAGMAQRLGADGGIVITASTNPALWNGLKLSRHDGTAPPADDAQRIIDDFRNDAHDYATDTAGETDDRGRAIHIDAVLAQV